MPGLTLLHWRDLFDETCIWTSWCYVWRISYHSRKIPKGLNIPRCLTGPPKLYGLVPDASPESVLWPGPTQSRYTSIMLKLSNQ